MTITPDAILTVQEVAVWLKITPRQVQRLGIPYLDMGYKTIRYRGADVLARLDALRRETPRPKRRRKGKGTGTAVDSGRAA